MLKKVNALVKENKGKAYSSEKEERCKKWEGGKEEKEEMVVGYGDG